MSKFIDLTGQIFSSWTVISRAEDRVNKSGKRPMWFCKCNCGQIREISSSDLKSGKSMSCGCLKKALLINHLHKSIEIGTVFGELTVLKDLGKTKSDYKYLCKCSCGKETTVFQGSLISHKTKSCGHIQSTKNGMSKHRLYPIYASMIDRATNPNNSASKNYMERGVTIHPDWSNDTPKGLENFIKWATTDGGWKPGLQLDKEAIDHDNLVYGPYTCKFVPRHVNIARCRKKDRATNSKFIGISKRSDSGRCSAVITYKRNIHHIGCFATELEAAKARDKYIKDNNLPHRLNFPNE